MKSTKIKLKKGMKVVINTGKDRGKVGKIVSINSKTQRAIVDGMNIYKKHVKPSKKYPQGGIVDFSAQINISNLSVICSSCNKITRLKTRNEGKEKVFICQKCKDVINES